MRKESKKIKVLGLGFKNTGKGQRIPNSFPLKKQLIDDLETQTNAKKELIENKKNKPKKKATEQEDIYDSIDKNNFKNVW